MTIALAAFLQQNADSLGLEEFSDGEQKLEVHVASEPSIDHDVAEMAEAELKQDEIARDCDTALEMYCGMEAYHNLLEQALDNGGISAESAAFMQVAVERYEAQFPTEEQAMPALEAFGGSSSRAASTQAAMSGLKEKMKKLWEATKMILKALMNMIKDVVTKATFAAERLEKRADAVAKKASGMNSAKKNAETITVKGGSLERVFMEGKYIGDDIVTSAGVFAEINVNLPKGLAKYVSDVASGIQSIDPTKGLTPGAMNAFTELNKIQEALTTAVVTSDKRFPDDVTVARSKTMPGNQAVYFSIPKKKDDPTQIDFTKTKLILLPVPDAKAAPTEHEISISVVGNLKTRATKIREVANKIANSSKDYATLENAIKQAMDAGDKLEERAAKAEMDKITENVVKYTLKNLSIIQRMAGNVNGVLSHSVRTLNAQLAIVERELSAYSTSEAKTD